MNYLRVRHKSSSRLKLAFDQLRNCLTEAIVKAIFRRNAEVTELNTDASYVRLGAMLMQSSVKDEPLKQVYYARKNTSETKTRYHSSILELL